MSSRRPPVAHREPHRTTLAALAFGTALVATSVQAQEPDRNGSGDTGSAVVAASPDAYTDPTARALHGAAVASWEYVDETVVSYTALVRSRMSAGLRTPLKDRTLYRSESASRVFWDRDRASITQLLANREQTPAGVAPPDVGNAMDSFFDPAGDRLFFGMTGAGEVSDEAGDDFFLRHPLAPDAGRFYRFQSGDTLRLSLPDGRSVQAVELRVLPRDADVHLISGSLWIEPGTGALVRAAYRLADRFDAFRDVPELRDDEDEDLKYVPGIFKPWTFDLSLIVVDYGLWDFSVWLPRSMRVEGVVAAGILKAPMEMDVSYRIESVVTEEDLTAAGDAVGSAAGLEERHFESRDEAMRFLASLMGGDEEAAFVLANGQTRRRGREVVRLVPEDPDWLHESPHLPPPIWKNAPGFPTGDEMDEMKDLLADHPQVNPTRTFWAANWGLERPDLVRYNRVEGPAVGAMLQLRTGSPFGPVSLELEPFLGFADLEPKATLSARWEGLRRRATLSAYWRLDSAPRRADAFGLGNSVSALLFGRDDGEYYRSIGASVTLTPPSAERQSWRAGAWVERQEAVTRKTDFALARSFDDDWRYRSNLAASRLDELGGEVVLSPWWGTDPLAPQLGAELYLQGGTTWDVDDVNASYGRASALLRAAIPFGLPEKWTWRAALEVEAGEAWGTLPPQRNWFLGSSATLRGYGPSTLAGESFGRARVELARVLPVASIAVFADGGWVGTDLDAFDEEDALFSVGMGVSVLDGLLRLDVARGLRDPVSTRWDFYLDSAF